VVKNQKGKKENWKGRGESKEKPHPVGMANPGDWEGQVLEATLAAGIDRNLKRKQTMRQIPGTNKAVLATTTTKVGQMQCTKCRGVAVPMNSHQGRKMMKCRCCGLVFSFKRM